MGLELPPISRFGTSRRRLTGGASPRRDDDGNLGEPSQSDIATAKIADTIKHTWVEPPT